MEPRVCDSILDAESLKHTRGDAQLTIMDTAPAIKWAFAPLFSDTDDITCPLQNISFYHKESFMTPCNGNFIYSADTAYKISLGFLSSTVEQSHTSTTVSISMLKVGGQNPGILIPPMVQIRGEARGKQTHIFRRYLVYILLGLDSGTGEDSNPLLPGHISYQWLITVLSS